MKIKKIEVKRNFKVENESKELIAYAEYDDDTNFFLELSFHMRIRLQCELRIGDMKGWAEVTWRKEGGDKWYPFYFLIKNTEHPIYSKMVKSSMMEWEKERNK